MVSGIDRERYEAPKAATPEIQCMHGVFERLVYCMETHRMERTLIDTPLFCDGFGGVHSGR